MTAPGMRVHEVEDRQRLVDELNALPPATDFRVPGRIIWYEFAGSHGIHLVMIDQGCIVLRVTVPLGTFGLGAMGHAI